MSLDKRELADILVSLGEKSFRAGQVFRWLHSKKVFDFDKMTDISVQLRAVLEENFCINRLFVQKRLESCVDNTVKYLYKLPDGNFAETVSLSHNYGNSICVSTQVGCKMGCRFCASAIAGYVRNLEPSEMLMQVYQTQLDTGVRPVGIVLMGIGEPLDNYDNVIKFLRLLSDNDGNNFSFRHVALSTCGIVPKIYELAKLKLGLTLSVSLHSPDSAKRSEIMPVNRKYDIPEIIKACKYYFSETGRRVTFEYAVMDGVNCSHSDAVRLAGLLKNMNAHVNLIPVNEVRERDYKTDGVRVGKFARELKNLGVNVSVRRTLGSDINGTCGQLRRDSEKYCPDSS